MKRRLASLLSLVLLLTAFVVSPVSAQAAPTLALVSLTHSASVKAGATLTFTAQVQVDAKVGIGYGYVYLGGPSEQNLPVRLVKAGPNLLKGSITLDPGMEPGAWSAYMVRLWDAAGNTIAVDEKTPGFRHPITITSSGKAVDVTPPQLLSLTVTEVAASGDAMVVTANVKEEASGVDYMTAIVQPVADEPLWTGTVNLFPTQKPGEYRGTMLTDITSLPARAQEVVRVYIRDKAGNETYLQNQDLADSKTVTTVEMRTVPEGLITSPYLNLMHPGEQSFWNWLNMDQEYASSLLDYAAEDPTTVRELIASELPQLQAAIDQLRKELFIDPNTQLKYSPYATTGKWMVLDRAVEARLRILVELDRLEQKTLPSLPAFDQEALTALYSLLGENDGWVPVENAFNDLYGQMAAAYVSFIGQSPQAVQVLKTPANESEAYGPMDQFDRDVIYLEPIYTERYPTLVDGTASLRVPVNASTSPARRMADLFYEIGRHFGQAYFSAFDDPARGTKWVPYLTLRGNQPWPAEAGLMALPHANLGDDFAYSYLPMDQGIQYFAGQAFPRLRENTTMETAFRKMVESKLSQAKPPVTITPGKFLQVGLSATFEASLTPSVPGAKLDSEGISWNKPGPSRKPVAPVTVNGTAQYRSADAQIGRTSWYFLNATGPDGRRYQRDFYYYRAPVLLDPVPGATNQSTLTLTGTAPAGSRVAVGEQSTTASADGRFALRVPLHEENNVVRVEVAGSPLAALVTIWYEPVSTTVPLTVTVPGVTSESTLTSVAKTEPYAMVTMNGLKAQADSDGNFPFRLPLVEGPNNLEFTAVNVAGNKATWTGTVTLDSEPPALEFSAPRYTNEPTFRIFGTVEPGSSIALNGQPLTADKEGHFAISVVLKEGVAPSLQFVATDAAGNRTVREPKITYVKDVPTFTKEREVTLTGKVEAGVALTYEGKAVPVSADGRFSLVVPVDGGSNEYILAMKRGDVADGFMQFVVANPLRVDKPVVQADGRIQISGRTIPGHVVNVGTELVPVDATGAWKAFVQPGVSSVKVTVFGQDWTVIETVTLP